MAKFTNDITDEDERRAIQLAQHQLALNERVGIEFVSLNIHVLRALLARATRAHD